MVTVVISTYNQLPTLPLTLQSMAVQKMLPSMVIVADDGSCDGTLEWLDSKPEYPFELRYVTHPHVGYGLTVIENLASRFVKDGRILFTNADLIHSPDSVLSHSEMGDGCLSGGLVVEIGSDVSGALRAEDVDDFPRIEAAYYGCKGELSNSDYFKADPEQNPYGIWGGNFSVAASAFSELDGFNEEYRFLYGGEESDLIVRLRKLGLSLAWAYNSTAYHLAHESRAYGKAALGNIKYRSEYMT